jgi:hypothetical protein
MAGHPQVERLERVDTLVAFAQAVGMNNKWFGWVHGCILLLADLLDADVADITSG